MAVMHRAKLNARQELFIVEYLKDGNGTKAAMRAGYAASSAAVHAHRLLKMESVLEKMTALRKRVIHRQEALVDNMLRELESIAFAEFDPALLFDRKGNLLPLRKMPKDALRAVDHLEVTELVGRKSQVSHVKFFRRDAFKMLAKALFGAPKRVKKSGYSAPV